MCLEKIQEYMDLRNKTACLQEKIKILEEKLKKSDSDDIKELEKIQNMVEEFENCKSQELKLYEELSEKDLISKQVDKLGGIDEFMKKFNQPKPEHSKKLSPEEQKELLEKLFSPKNIKRPHFSYLPNFSSINQINKTKTKHLMKGWKKVQENKTFDVRFRVTATEKETLMENLNKAGYTNISEYLRDVSCKNKPSIDDYRPNIVKYELSDDLRGLKAYVDSTQPTDNAQPFYHIHSDELTCDQRIIHELLMREKVLLLEKLTK